MAKEEQKRNARSLENISLSSHQTLQFTLRFFSWHVLKRTNPKLPPIDSVKKPTKKPPKLKKDSVIPQTFCLFHLQLVHLKSQLLKNSYSIIVIIPHLHQCS